MRLVQIEVLPGIAVNMEQWRCDTHLLEPRVKDTFNLVLIDAIYYFTIIIHVMKSKLKQEFAEILNDTELLIVRYYLQAIVFAIFSLILYILFKFSLDIIDAFYQMSLESQVLRIIGSSIAFLLIITSGMYVFFAVFYLIEIGEKCAKYLYRHLVN